MHLYDYILLVGPSNMFFHPLTCKRLFTNTSDWKVLVNDHIFHTWSSSAYGRTSDVSSARISARHRGKTPRREQESSINSRVMPPVSLPLVSSERDIRLSNMCDKSQPNRHFLYKFIRTPNCLTKAAMLVWGRNGVQSGSVSKWREP